MATQITHLKLTNWRNFRKADIELQDRMFIVGPNAAGKSNLVDALRFLRDLATPGGGLVNAVRDRQGIKHLRSLHARNNATVAVEVTLTLDGDPSPWTYKIEFKSTDGAGPVLVGESVKHADEPVLQRPDEEDKNDPQRLTETHLEQTSRNKGFRTMAEALASVFTVHIVPQVAKSGRADELAPRDAPGSDFVQQIARLGPKAQRGAVRRIEKLLKIAVPSFSELRVRRDDDGKPHLEAKFDHWRPQGAWQNEQEFSDGTLRLIGLLWAIDHGDAPIVLEEPELSLHEDVVRELPRVFSRAARRNQRQFIVTTHSPQMLRDRGVGPEEIVILMPTSDGTEVSLGSEDDDIVALAGSKVGLADVVRSATRPKNIEQLGLPEIR